VDWILLAQDKDQWGILVIAVMNLKGGEFIDQLSEYQLFKNVSAP
jgi:hypothetical protein